MIVETMSYEEMARESNHIIETYSKRVKDRFSPGQPEFNKLKRYMLKHKTSRNVKGDLVKYKISTTNTFYSIPLILNYKSFKILRRIIQIPFITYVNSHGMNVITDIESSENKLEFLFFTSHFFRRYVCPKRRVHVGTVPNSQEPRQLDRREQSCHLLWGTTV